MSLLKAVLLDAWMVIIPFPLSERCGQEPTLLGVWRRQVEKAILRKLMNKACSTCQTDTYRLYFGETLNFSISWLLCWCGLFLFSTDDFAKCWRGNSWKMKDSDLLLSVKTLSGSSNGRRIFLVSFVFWQMVGKFHMLIPFRAMCCVCWIPSSGIN